MSDKNAKIPEKARNRVFVFDTTLRDGEQSPGCSMNLREKLQVAHQLHRLRVDIIEAGFPISSIGDFEAVKAIASEVGTRDDAPVIAGLARSREGDIRRCAEAIAPAKRGRIHTFIATSPIHMEHKLRMKPEQVLANAVEMVKLARSLCDDVEFSLEDAGRTEWPFMVEVVEAVIAAGASTVNIPDTVGYCQPEQYAAQIAYILEHVPNAGEAVISVHCHDDLGLAVANSLAAVAAGARQIECTINGIGERAGNASLEEVVMNFKTRPDFFDVDTRINIQEIYRASRLVSDMTGSRVQANKAIVGANAFAHEAGIHQDGVLKNAQTYEIMTPESVGWTGEGLVMGKHSGRHAFRTRLQALGYELSDTEFQTAFDRFKDLCDKKKEVYEEDLIALADQVISKGAAARWELKALSVMTGLNTRPTACVCLTEKGEERWTTGMGDGPVDAAYKAIDAIVGQYVHVIDFNLAAIGEGEDAQGRVTIRIQRQGESRSVKGRGVDTDIIHASVKAYVNALNSLHVQEEAAKRTNGETVPKAAGV